MRTLKAIASEVTPKRVLMVFIIIVAILIIVQIIYVSISACKLNRNPIDKFMEADDRVYDIDAVITWVDSSDEDWQRQLNDNIDKYLCTDASKREKCLEYNLKDRFPNAQYSEVELYYCISCIIKFAPWIRNIYLVTMRPQFPSFLDQLEKEVLIVHHDEIFVDPTVLPVFQSNTIECNLHRIPGLSEHFIYFNDDTYITNYCEPTDFFRNGHPLLNETTQQIFNSIMVRCYTNIIKRWVKYINIEPSTLNWMDDVSRILNIYQPISPNHGILPMSKSLVAEIFDVYSEIFLIMSSAKFRDENDVHFIPVMLNYGILDKRIYTGEFYTQEHIEMNLNYNCTVGCDNSEVCTKCSNDLENTLSRLYPPPVVLCVNNVKTPRDYEIVAQYLDSILNLD